MSAMPGHIETYVLDEEPALAVRLLKVFGRQDDPVAAVERRARELLSEYRTILWEGDPQTFQFSYVSAVAEDILGYPASRWTEEPAFWTETVVHPEDRDEAVAFCALATGQNRDHDFCYRARTADGRIVMLLDVVQVTLGSRGVAVKLRGLMVEMPADRAARRQSARPLRPIGS